MTDETQQFLGPQKPRTYWGYATVCGIWAGLVGWAVPDGWVVMVPCVLFGMALALSLRRFN